MKTRIREARVERLGYTQRELARALGIGEVVISKWERGVSVPRLTNLRELATLAGVSVSWFYAENGGTAA